MQPVSETLPRRVEYCADVALALPPLRSRPPSKRSERSREALLFKRYQRFGDTAARDELVARFLPLAKKIARRYDRGAEPLDDLIQVASLALVKAIDRFDPDRGDAFSSYAVPTILGELKRHFRDTSWALHVPRGMQERVLTINAAVTRLAGQNGTSPTPKEVAAEVGLPVEEVLEGMEAAGAFDTASLDAPRQRGEDDDGTFADTVGEEDAGFDLVVDSTVVGTAFKALPRRERAILYWRFAEELTQREVADRLGISQMHVSRLQRRALDRLRLLSGDWASSEFS
ncbi:MAG TPA: SigB/SigF/SigG family RNA polymerase sigma factor [Thermoleophilaceae bacterium]